MKTRYFYLLMEDRKILGPFPAATLDRMYKQGTLSGESLISPDKTDWKPLKDVFYDYLHLEQTQELQAPSYAVPEVCRIAEPVTISAPAEEKAKPLPVPLLLASSKFHVIGSALNLIWNAAEKLEELSHHSPRTIFRTVLPLCFFFPLTIDIAAALSAAIFLHDAGKKVLFVSIVFLLESVLNLLLLLCFNHKSSEPEKNRPKTMLFSGMLWINSGAMFCIGTLNYAIASAPAPSWAHWSYGTLTFLAFSFFCANFSSGIRKGLEFFYGISPRKALWSTALFLGMNLGILKAAELLGEKFF